MILPAYAVLFLLALPLLRLRPRTLALLASALAISGPMLSYLIRDWLHLTPASTPSVPGPSALLSSAGGVTSLVINGAYPAMTVLPFMLAGMSVGCLDLCAPSVHRRLLGAGAALSAAGDGGAALALRAGDLAAHIGSRSAAAGHQQLHSVATAEAGTVPTTSWAWLLTAGPHSGTPMEIIGATGCALAVLGAALMIGHRADRVLHPIIAVGMMPLTAYTAHVIAIWLIQPPAGTTRQAGSPSPPSRWQPWPSPSPGCTSFAAARSSRSSDPYRTPPASRQPRNCRTVEPFRVPVQVNRPDLRPDQPGQPGVRQGGTHRSRRNAFVISRSPGGYHLSATAARSARRTVRTGPAPSARP